MTGPAHLLEVVVAPDRDIRKHARNRIDHALDGPQLESPRKVVRRLIRKPRPHEQKLTTMPFSGWSDAALDFYRRLEAQNGRAF